MVTSVSVPLHQLRAWPGHRGLSAINPIMINQGHHQTCALKVCELTEHRNEGCTGIWAPFCRRSYSRVNLAGLVLQTCLSECPRTGRVREARDSGFIAFSSH